jgi:polysaccharide pyruvyl transferase WcaK-like protein
MIIEIRKAGFVNKGAELMLLAVLQQIEKRYPEATLVIAPTHLGGSFPFPKFAKLGLQPKAWLWRYGYQWGDLARFIPKKLREMYGVILDKDVDVVLDAAGFAYSDQWGINNCKELARASKRWKKNGTTVILLPQALGPFENSKIIPYVKEWVSNIDLVFAREADSLNYLINIVGVQSKILRCSDFTNLLQGVLPDGYDPTNKYVALVPNYRMIDKTSKEESEAYLLFMVRCTMYLVNKGKKPFILVHEGSNDKWLADKISKAVGGVPIVTEGDPLMIKGIIGACQATIGSRFHGIVSALSQGVPTLATGWSHKYKRLFNDYEFDDGMISVLDSEQELYKKIDLITDDEFSHRLRDHLIIKSEELKAKSEEMWDLVFEKITREQH